MNLDFNWYVQSLPIEIIYLKRIIMFYSSDSKFAFFCIHILVDINQKDIHTNFWIIIFDFLLFIDCYFWNLDHPKIERKMALNHSSQIVSFPSFIDFSTRTLLFHLFIKIMHYCYDLYISDHWIAKNSVF